MIIERIKASVDDEEDIDIEDRLDMLSEIESDSGGSDSSVSDGLPMQLLHATVPEVGSVGCNLNFHITDQHTFFHY